MQKLPSQNQIVPTSDAEISMAESQLGLEFSEEYREFLRWNGGLWIKESAAVVDVPDFGRLHMQWFYGVHPKDQGKSDLVLANEEFKGRIPPECISIGYDQMGNQLLLVASGDDAGTVLFWDHDQEGFETPTAGSHHNVYVLAPTLAQLCELFASPKA